MNAWTYYTRCHEWPHCTGHAGPSPAERWRERYEAARRVAAKRAIRREFPEYREFVR